MAKQGKKPKKGDNLEPDDERPGEQDSTSEGGGDQADAAQASNLKEKEDRLQELIEAYLKDDEQRLKDVIEIGTLLNQIKTGLGHTNWTGWAEASVKRFGVRSVRTLNRWMAVARHHAKGTLKGIKKLNDAYDKIAEARDRDGGGSKLAKTAYKVSKKEIEAITELIEEKIAADNNIPTITISVVKKGLLRKAFKKAVDEQGEKLLESGGVIIIESPTDDESNVED